VEVRDLAVVGAVLAAGVLDLEVLEQAAEGLVDIVAMVAMVVLVVAMVLAVMVAVEAVVVEQQPPAVSVAEVVA
jgi:hypothetical protein